MTFNDYKNEIINCLKAKGLTDEQVMAILQAKDIIYGWNNGVSAEDVAKAILM